MTCRRRILPSLCYFSLMQQGQGLGRSEQGMSQALSVEKTSKRGGRIVHERDRRMLPPKMPPPNTGNQFGESFKNAAQENTQDPATPPSLSQCEEGNENKLFPTDTEREYGGFGSTAGREYGEYGDQSEETIPKPSITELMKNPSKVVLCKVRCFMLWCGSCVRDSSPPSFDLMH